jgi:hypothetical protein
MLHGLIPAEARRHSEKVSHVHPRTYCMVQFQLMSRPRSEKIITLPSIGKITQLNSGRGYFMNYVHNICLF